MYKVLACIAVDHDLRFVLVAAVVCATAAAAAFGAHARLARARDSARWVWGGLTAVVAGCGAWATHFIAMLAYEPRLQIGYATEETALSLVIAIIGMGTGFTLSALYRSKSVAIAAGGFTGLSVAAMHFVGIAGVRAAAQIAWDAPYVVAAVVVATIGGAAAFWVRAHRPAGSAWRAPAAILVLTIVALHFTAMAGVVLVPDPRIVVPAKTMSRETLLVATVGLAGLVLIIAAALGGMERAARRSTLRSLRHALDSVPGGLAFYDAAGRLTAWNRPFAELIGSAGVSPARGASYRSMLAAVEAAGWFEQVVGDRPAELDTWDATHGMKFRIPDGRWLKHDIGRTDDGGAVATLTDITAEKERVFALAAARDHAEATSRAKTAFLANISHEIRTPLNGVLTVAEVLDGSKLDARQRELVSVILGSARHLDALLGDLLDLAKSEAGELRLNVQPTDVSALVEEVRALFASQAESKQLALRSLLSTDVTGWVMCDPLRLRQILANLVSNAVKFTEAGEVVLSARRVGNDGVFEVRDTGCGFDAEAVSAMFDRFSQADDSSTRRHGGAGLGLAICADYARLMGGRIEAEGAPGAGALFRVTVPLPPVEAPHSATSDPLSLDGAPLRVLIVDDNPVNRQVLGAILDAVGVEHAAAEDGAQGVEAAQSGAFDVVLMDIQMPVMDGLEATRRIRAWETAHGRTRMPIIIVSANCLQEHIDAGVAAGADDHLSKPVSVPQLVGAIEQHAPQRLAA